MAEHEPCIGATDDWYTPPAIFAALGERFDLDPCSPGSDHWVPADRVYTKADDGLAQPWRGFVFMNPPFGGRCGHVPWLERFLRHGDGIAVVRAYTSAAWFHEHAVHADAMLFPRGKTKFVRPDGSVGGSPGHGVVLLGMGERACAALERSGLGLFVRLRQRCGFYEKSRVGNLIAGGCTVPGCSVWRCVAADRTRFSTIPGQSHARAPGGQG